MKTKLFALLITFCTSFGYAQSTYIRSIEGLEEIRENMMAFNSIDYDEIKGSPFNTETYADATIKMSSGKEQTLPTLLNFYNQEILVEIDEKVYNLRQKPYIESITTAAGVYKTIELSIDGDDSYYFAKIISEGKYSLYEITVSKFIEEKKAKTPYDKAIEAQFKNKIYNLVTHGDDNYVIENNRDVKGMVDALGFSRNDFKSKLKQETLVLLIADLNGQ